MIRSPGAALSHRARLPSGGILRSLMFDLAVELGAEDEGISRQIHPGEQAGDRRQRAVGGGVIGDLADVETKRQRQQQPNERGED